MDNSNELEGFEIHDVSEEEASPCSEHVEVIDIWEPIKGQSPSQGEQNGQEDRQWILTCWVMGLPALLIIAGLVVFILTGNSGLLTGVVMGILAILKQVFDYYFRLPKK